MPPRLLSHAKRMRREPTIAEALLWQRLRAHRFAGFKFKRQQPIGRYIVDFVCFAKHVVIEVDGSQHGEAAGYDEQRSKWLASQGFVVLRFWNDEVLAKADLVLDAIWDALQER